MAFIIKLGDYYLEWSDVTDSPITFGMKLEDFEIYYNDSPSKQYSSQSLEERLARVEEKGVSAYMYASVDEVIAGNRAGPDEEELTKEEIYRLYCLQESEDVVFFENTGGSYDF